MSSTQREMQNVTVSRELPHLTCQSSDHTSVGSFCMFSYFLLSFPEGYVCEIHLCCIVCVQFHCHVVSYCMNIPQLTDPYFCNEYLGYFQLEVITSCVTMNSFIYVLHSNVCISFAYTLKSDARGNFFSAHLWSFPSSRFALDYWFATSYSIPLRSRSSLRVWGYKISNSHRLQRLII